MTTRLVLFLGLAFFYGLAVAAALVGVSSDELQALQDKGALVVDVRTPKEWKETGMIPGSHPLTYFDANGHYDQTAWLQALKPLLTRPDQPVVLVCRSGNRSGTVGKFLESEAGFGQVYHLEKGLRAWSAEGKSLQSPCPTDAVCGYAGQTGKPAP